VVRNVRAEPLGRNGQAGWICDRSRTCPNLRAAFDRRPQPHHNQRVNRPRLFDTRLTTLRRRRALRHPVNGADFLLRHATVELTERLGAVQREFATGADIGSPTPLLAQELAGTGLVGTVWRLDEAPEARPDVVASPEALPIAPGSLDMAVSVLALHAVNDLPGTLVQIRGALKPDGLFAATLAGGDTLIELREALMAAEAETTGGAAARVAPMADLRDHGALLQRAGFALPVADRETLTVRYGSVAALMHDLRAMGATNVLADRSGPLTRTVLARCEEIYAKRFSDTDGRLRATFELHHLSGWAPDASQQKPLKPDSAAARLADALGTAERPAGDKAGR